MRTMLRELFQGLSSSVGHWPRSSAYYALDVLYDDYANASATANGHNNAPNTDNDTTSGSNSSNNNSSSDSDSDRNSNVSSSNSSNNSSDVDLTPYRYHPPVPKLVEINYMGDWKALKKITVLEKEERRARESSTTGARENANSTPNPDVGSSPDLAAIPDSTPNTNHNSVPVKEFDEVMLEWVEDLLTVLATNNPPNPDRCIPLHHNEP